MCTLLSPGPTAQPTLHAADGICGSPPRLRKVFLTLTLRWRPLKIKVFVANITNEFILGLDILRAYDAVVDLGRHMLSLVEKEVSLWSPGAGPWPSIPVVANNQVTPEQCEEVVTARLESPIGVENCLVEPSPGPPGCTHEDPECYPSRPETHERIRPGTL
jgi:hypothetical protein